jgi:hypothetical protein
VGEGTNPSFFIPVLSYDQEKWPELGEETMDGPAKKIVIGHLERESMNFIRGEL